MEANLVPYRAEHRYWTGLLLLVRIALYTGIAMDTSHEKSASLLATGLTVMGLLLLKMFIGQVYRKGTLDQFNSLSFFNLLMLSLASLYTLRTSKKSKKFVAYVSTSITFIMFVGVILYHIMYALIKVKCLQHFAVSVMQKMSSKGISQKIAENLEVSLLCSEGTEMQVTGTNMLTTTVVGLSPAHSASQKEMLNDCGHNGKQEQFYKVNDHTRKWTNSDRLRESLLQDS